MWIIKTPVTNPLLIINHLRIDRQAYSDVTHSSTLVQTGPNFVSTLQSYNTKYQMHCWAFSHVWLNILNNSSP